MNLAGRLRANAPDWGCLEFHALEPRNLPRVLVGIGFNRQCGPYPLGGSDLFKRADLHVFRPWRAIYAKSDTIAARGWRAGHWTPEIVARLDADDERKRAEIAWLNNAYMDRPVRMLMRDTAPRLQIEIDTWTGEWCDTTGGQRGESIIELGALALACRFGQAGYRIARLCGLREVPVGNAQ